MDFLCEHGKRDRDPCDECMRKWQESMRSLAVLIADMARELGDDSRPHNVRKVYKR